MQQIISEACRKVREACFAYDLLHRVLAELRGGRDHQLGGVLEHVHGFMKIEFEAAPEQRPGLGAGSKEASGRGLAELVIANSMLAGSAAVIKARSQSSPSSSTA